MTWRDWLVIPAVAALIGWFTNWVAVRMIFRPHRVVRILGMPVQGLLPKRRNEFADSIGRTVADHLVSAEDVLRLLSDPKLTGELEGVVRARLDDFMEKKLASVNPMLGMFLKGPIAVTIKESLVGECRTMLAAAVETAGRHVEENLDLRTVVVAKIRDFDMQKLEDIVVSVAKRELFWIEILGAILGFLVGLGQVALFALLR